LVSLLDGVPVVGLEIGVDQADEVEALLREARFGSVVRLRDLAGIERVIVGRR
jgi:methylase of polypeptide subunit release factors